MRIGEFIGQMLDVVIETLVREFFKRNFYYDKKKIPGLKEGDPEIPSFCKINIENSAGTKNFSISEFHSKDGVQVPEALRGNIQALMEQLEVIKTHFGGARIIISSGYRSPTHNKKVDGARRSRHMCGQAADFKIQGSSAKEVQKGILELIAKDKIINGGLGSYPNFTHYDTGPTRRWTEKNKKFWNF